MSAPTTSDPLVVTTADGASWWRRAVTQDGRGLYAVASACACCPPYLMLTLAELAEHGIRGQADALPMPVGLEPRCVEVDLAGANLSLWEEEQDNARLRLALASAQRGRRELRARVTELEAQRERRRVRLVELQNDALSMRGSLSPNGEDRKVPFPLGETLTPAVDWLIARVAELEAERHSTNEALSDAAEQLRLDRAAPATVYRASHDSIAMGLYITPEAAREHCETLVRRELGTGGTLGWIPDDGSKEAPEELSVFGPGWDEEGPDETCTGYVVTPLDVASAYDPDADE